jgi:hypothetical protein
MKLIVWCLLPVVQGARLRSQPSTDRNDSNIVLARGAQKEVDVLPDPDKPHVQVLQNYQNVQYFADFLIGGQKIRGIFDTGSFELIVRSTRCSSCKHPTTPYDRKKSTTYEKNGTVIRHVFGSGPCMSMMGYEEVNVGPMSTPHQAFWEITSHQIPVLDFAKFAAIVGIGPNFAYGNTEKTLLMSYGVDEFSVCLGKTSGSDGYLTWGPVASKATKKAAFTSVPVIGEHHWVTQMTNVGFGEGTGVACSGNTPCAAIIDSGTSLIAAPGIALMQLSDMVGPINEDCSNLKELPHLHFNLGDGEIFTLPPAAYVMRINGAVMEAESIWDLLFFKPKMRKVNMCMPAFMQLDMISQFGPVWILGMPFFRYHHTSFDRVNKQMHFAKAGPKCNPEPYPSQKGNATSFIATRTYSGIDFEPNDVDIQALIPPTLSSMLEVAKDGYVKL